MLYPMVCMVLLTVVVAVIALKARFASVKNGQLSLKYYSLMKGEEEPEFITRTTRCFNNLFEMPVLFYVACSLYVSLKVDSLVALIFAWTFVGLRLLQAWVHLTSNNVAHRMYAYWGGLLCVLGLWFNLMWHY